MYLSILGVVLLCYISTEKYIHGSVDIYYILDILIGLSVFKKLIIIFSALPCVTGFYDDWKHQYIKNIVIRTGRRNRMAMPELRLCPQREKSSDEMSGLRTPASLFRAEEK